MSAVPGQFAREEKDMSKGNVFRRQLTTNDEDVFVEEVRRRIKGFETAIGQSVEDIFAEKTRLGIKLSEEIQGKIVPDDEDLPDSYERTAGRTGFAKALIAHAKMGLTTLLPGDESAEEADNVAFERKINDDHPPYFLATQIIDEDYFDEIDNNLVWRLFNLRVLSIQPLKACQMIDDVYNGFNPPDYRSRSGLAKFINNDNGIYDWGKELSSRFPDVLPQSLSHSFITNFTEVVLQHEPNRKLGQSLSTLKYSVRAKRAREYLDTLLNHELGHYIVLFLDNDQFRGRWIRLMFDEMKEIVNEIETSFRDIAIGMDILVSLDAAVDETIRLANENKIPSLYSFGQFFIYYLAIEYFADAWMMFVAKNTKSEQHAILENLGYRLTSEKFQFLRELLVEELRPRNEENTLFAHIREEIQDRDTYRMSTALTRRAPSGICRTRGVQT